MLISRTKHPPCGWNSYDSFGVYINQEQALANLEVFAKKLAPAGYEYFTLDAGWYFDGDFLENMRLRKEGRTPFEHVDDWGRRVGSPSLFPDGLAAMADRCHNLGLKFGLHVMRGLPAKAVEINTPIKGHPSARARDIYDPDNPCTWSATTRGINMDKPGAQEYYNSVVEYLAQDVGVDLIKLDDVVEFPREVEAFARAIEKVERPILLSLSPGNETYTGNWPLFRKWSNMVRITGDVWDRDSDNAMKFDRWALFEEMGSPECWIDLDMIPLGGIQVNVPEGTPNDLIPVLGCRRQSNVTPEGKKIMMTQFALAASPLIFGGDLPSTTDEDIRLVTDADMLACNRNGITGRRIFHQRHLDIRRALKHDDPDHGWIGIFNHQSRDRLITLKASEMGFCANRLPSAFFDIWQKKMLPTAAAAFSTTMKAQGVLFLRY